MPWSLVLILLMALALRILVVIPPAIDWDESWVGVGAMNVLKGVFPPFFYGQPYMASLEDFLHALVFAGAGPARWSLKVVPVILAVVFVYLAFRVAFRIFDGEAAYAVALVAAFPPPQMVSWTVSARLHYSLTPVLGVLFLLVAVEVMIRPEARRPARWFVLGLLSGLIWWNNYIGVIYLAAVWCVLLAAQFRLFLASFARYAVPGFFVGSLPLWLYNLRIGTPFVSPRGTWASWTDLPERVLGFVTTTLQILIGFDSPPHLTIEWAFCTVLVAGTLALGLAASLWHAARGDLRAALAPFVFLNMLGLVAISVYGVELPSRYLFPLFAVIPLLVGAAFGVIARWSRALGWGVLTLLVVVNGWSSITLLSGLARPERIRDLRAEEADETKLFARLRELGLTHAYTFGGEELNFPSGGSLVFSSTFDTPYPPFGWAVDGATRIAYVSRERGDSLRLEAGLAALGADYRAERVGPRWLYHGFSLPQLRYEEIPQARWTATADEMPERAFHAFDRNIDTLWYSEPGQRPGVAFVLDLGRVETVGMLSWLPGRYPQVPRMIRVEVSPDGLAWRTVFMTPATTPAQEFPVYWSGTHPFLRLRRARVEVRFAATRARLVRITQTGLESEHPWSIRELFVYRPLADPPAPRFETIDAMAARIAGAGFSKVYGDHWALARLHVASGGAIRALSSNVYVDNHGRSDLYRGWAHPPEYERIEPFLLPRTAVVLEEWTGAALAFEETMREAGYSYAREVHGGYVLYSRLAAPKRPEPELPRPGWRASASVASEWAALVLDGDAGAGSRWTTAEHTAQVPGLWFAVDMRAPTPIGAIELVSGSTVLDYPRGLVVSGSPDGDRWERLPAKLERWGPLAWDGTHVLYRGVERTVVRFPPRSVRAIRVTQTGVDGIHPWSIDEFNVYGPAAGLPD
jgi:hypothetical protein